MWTSFRRETKVPPSRRFALRRVTRMPADRTRSPTSRRHGRPLDGRRRDDRVHGRPRAGGNVASCEVRGGAPGTRGTDILQPGTILETANAIVLTGGSAFGLAAAGGVERYLEERGIGSQIGPFRDPLGARRGDLRPRDGRSAAASRRRRGLRRVRGGVGRGPRGTGRRGDGRDGRQALGSGARDAGWRGHLVGPRRRSRGGSAVGGERGGRSGRRERRAPGRRPAGRRRAPRGPDPADGHGGRTRRSAWWRRTARCGRRPCATWRRWRTTRSTRRSCPRTRSTTGTRCSRWRPARWRPTSRRSGAWRRPPSRRRSAARSSGSSPTRCAFQRCITAYARNGRQRSARSRMSFVVDGSPSASNPRRTPRSVAGNASGSWKPRIAT